MHTLLTRRHIGIKAFLTLLFVSLAGCGGGGGSSGGGSEKPPTTIDPATIGFQTYLAQTYKIAYPGTWYANSVVGEEPDVVGNFSNADGDVIVLVLQSTADIKQSDADLAAATVVSSRQVSAAGVNATEEILDATVKHDDGSMEKVKVMLTTLTLNGTNYGIAYLALPKAFDVYLEVARHIAASLNINQTIFSNLSSSVDEKPAIATDRDNFLVVKCNYSGDTSTSGPSSLAAKIIYRDRTTSATLNISTTTVAASTSDKCSFDPSAAYDGQNFLVAYASAGHIYAKRIKSDGTILDTTPIQVSNDGLSYSAQKPQVVFDGAQFFVVWYTGGEPYQLRGAKVDPSGTASSTVLLQDIGLAAICGIEPHVALGSGNILLMWSQDPCASSLQYLPRALSTRLYDLDGNPLAEPLQISAAGSDLMLDSQLSSDGENYLVSWVGGRFEPSFSSVENPAFYAARISREGLPLDNATGGVAITPPVGWSISSGSSLTLNFHSGRYFFTWNRGYLAPHTNQGIYGFSTNQDLSELSLSNPSDLTPLAAGSNRHGAAALAFSNHQLLLVSQYDGNVYGWFFGLEDF